MNSLINPLNKGSPQIANAPTRNKKLTSGMARAKPPIWSISPVCVFWMTAPAPKNKSPLKIAKPSVARASGAAKKKDGLAELKFKLQKAIEKEAFEEAARLRDEIKVLEKKQPEKGEA